MARGEERSRSVGVDIEPGKTRRPKLGLDPYLFTCVRNSAIIPNSVFAIGFILSCPSIIR